MKNKKQSILISAIELLLQNGVKKTTMDDIAAYAMCSKVTIYKYFKDKDTLLVQIGEHIYTQNALKISNVISSEKDLVSKLYDFIDVISTFSDTGEYDLCEDLISYKPALKSAYENYKQTYEDALNTLIDLSVKSGITSPKLTQEMIFHYIDMGVQYYRGNERYRNKLHNDNSYRERFMSFLIGNIFTDTDDIKSTLTERKL